MLSTLLRLSLCLCLIVCASCAPSKQLSRPPSPTSLGVVQKNDIEPCRALVADTGPNAADALKADSENAGAHIECQARQLGLLGIVWELIARGVLTIQEDSNAYRKD